MDTLQSLLEPGIHFLVPQPCYDKFFIDYNFSDADCLKTVVSKCLGFGIILGSVLVKVPQIAKIAGSKSGKGISLISTTFELIAQGATLAYGYANAFPFSSYGDSFSMSIQTLIIAAMVLAYGGNTTGCMFFTVIYTILLAFLLSPAAPLKLLLFLQICVTPIILIARLIQIYENYSNNSTGQLSAVTLFLLFAGSLARIFTSIQETGDMNVIIMYIAATSCNAILSFQMLYYWNAEQKKKSS